MSNDNLIQAVRGMNDITPNDTVHWQYLEKILRESLAQYGYQEFRFPIVEKTELFKRSVGEATDIVEKEMYTFEDRNGESLSLRPEGTAPCVRAALEQALLYNQQQRLWYMGPMFRHERPQKGRYRQFYQLGVEVFGMATPETEVEIISLTALLWQRLGLQEHLSLQINSLGTPEERIAYRQALVNYLLPLREQLDEDSQRRLTTNPLRILDSKNSDVQALLKNAPQLNDYLSDKSKQHIGRVCELLSALGIAYQMNSRLVRGLDYYTDTVFEWVTDKLGAQATVCAGGRYDGLVKQLGGQATPAAGFGLGIERLLILLETLELLPARPAQADVYCVMIGAQAELVGMQLAQKARLALPELRIITNGDAGSFKTQFKRADKSGANLALILAEEELAQGVVTIKYLRSEREQERVKLEGVIDFLVLLFS